MKPINLLLMFISFVGYIACILGGVCHNIATGNPFVDMGQAKLVYFILVSCPIVFTYAYCNFIRNK